VFSISGNADTGKSLLIHDIAKDLIRQGKSVCLVHSGHLNEGHYKLKELKDWPIYSAKNFLEMFIFDKLIYDFLIFDDVQSLNKIQFDTIKEIFINQNKRIILSADSGQLLWDNEVYNAYHTFLKSVDAKSYELSNKIKTNLEIASFMSCVFNKKKQPKKLNYNNIELSYFSSENQIRKHIASLKASGWQDFYFSESIASKKPFKEFNSFKDIKKQKESGQSYDRVALVIDKNFIYNEEGKLMVACNKDYQSPMILHQIMTRTIKKIHVIILDNEPLLDHLLNILEHDC
jgi:hypothetical protein